MVELHEETDVLQFRDPNQPSLHLVYWTRSGPIEKQSPALLFINHGIGEHSGRYRTLVSDILAKVPALDAVISYDMRQHGRSGPEGERGATRSIEEYVEDLRTHVLPAMCLRYGADARVIIFGHSLGGAVIAACAARPDCLASEGCGSVRGVILSAPALEIRVSGSVNRVLAPMASLLVRVPGVKGMMTRSGIDPNLLSHDKQIVETYKNDELVHDHLTMGVGAEFLSYNSKVLPIVKGKEAMIFDNVPTLVLHGTGDQVVKIEGSRRLVEALREKGKGSVKMVEIEGAYHEMHNEPDDLGRKQFVDSVTDFVNSTFAAS